MSNGLIFHCPGCDAEFEADLTMIGTESQCPECGARFVVPTPIAREGMEIAGFKLKSKLGEGGMGEVWLAEQMAMGRVVALKLLSPSLVGKPDFVKRFMHEIRMAGRLEHPNIITAFDAGEVQGFFYLAMAYCDGVELSDRMRIDGRIPEKEALKIVRDIALALDYAWTEHQILHRDIKPSNIMLDSKGGAKLMDMGISKSFKDTPEMTVSGTIVGTPYYISPEQGRADAHIDFHSDIYSLGATLYHMVTGQFPFDGESTMDIVAKHVNQPLKPPRQVNPALSSYVCALIEKMMAKNPLARQASWKNVVADINLVLNGKLPNSAPISESIPQSPVNHERTITMTPAKIAAAADIKITINTPDHLAAVTPLPNPEPPSAMTPPLSPSAMTKPEPPPRPEEKRKPVKTPPPSRPRKSSWAPVLLTVAIIAMAGLCFLRVIACFSTIENTRLIKIDGNQLRAAEDIVAKLRSDAANLVAQKRLADAVALLIDYNGDLAAETVLKRRELAKQLQLSPAEREKAPASKDGNEQ